MSDQPLDLTPGQHVKRLPKKDNRLSGAVPVRFSAETIDRIKTHAQREGRTVSSWIRHEVEEALNQREVTVINFRPTSVDPHHLRHLRASDG